MHTLVIKIVNGTAVWQYNVVASDCNNHGGKFRNFKGGVSVFESWDKKGLRNAVLLKLYSTQQSSEPPPWIHLQ